MLGRTAVRVAARRQRARAPRAVARATGLAGNGRDPSSRGAREDRAGRDDARRGDPALRHGDGGIRGSSPPPERRTLIYRGRRLVPKARHVFGWLSTVGHWEVERHEVRIELDHDVVQDVHAQIRYYRLTEKDSTRAPISPSASLAPSIARSTSGSTPRVRSSGAALRLDPSRRSSSIDRRQAAQISAGNTHQHRVALTAPDRADRLIAVVRALGRVRGRER